MTDVDLASMQGLALGLSMGITLLYIARRRLGGSTRTAQETIKLQEHADLINELAMAKLKMDDLTTEILGLNARLESALAEARGLQNALAESKGTRRWVCQVCKSVH